MSFKRKSFKKKKRGGYGRKKKFNGVNASRGGIRL